MVLQKKVQTFQIRQSSTFLIAITSLFTKSPWQGDCDCFSVTVLESNFHLPAVYHIACKLHSVPFYCCISSQVAMNTNFQVIGSTRPGIEPKAIVSVTDPVSPL